MSLEGLPKTPARTVPGSTEGLYLEQLAPSHVGALSQFATDAAIQQYFYGGATGTQQAMAAWVHHRIQLGPSGLAESFAIRHPNHGLIGYIGLSFEGIGAEPELGFWVARPFRRLGVGSWAVREIVRRSLRCGQCEGLIAACASYNSGAIRMLLRSRFAKIPASTPRHTWLAGKGLLLFRRELEPPETILETSSGSNPGGNRG